MAKRWGRAEMLLDRRRRDAGRRAGDSYSEAVVNSTQSVRPGHTMPRRVVVSIIASLAALIASPGLAVAQTWSSGGLPQSAFEPSPTASAPAPRRDLSGIWDAGRDGIAPTGHVAAPFTP